ncbi:MAG TPA: alkaline phosphatase family protein, partial [Methylomirabilota bacterium]|nr:alkaline phosphatase family protein [Methylomirabilota bacterium]
SHGIISNDWFDKNSRRDVYCTEDQSVDGVGATPGAARSSPKNLVGDTLADEMRLRFGSKVIGLSIKDRAAILPAGKKPTGAFWFHGKNGNFVTSTYYMERLPRWVEEFNARKLPKQFVGQKWARLLDEKYYPESDTGYGEGNLGKEKKPVFDHKVPSSDEGFEDVVATPFGNQLLAELAQAAVQGEKLGQEGRVDLLTISFSSVDAIGHRFGPYSQEVHDAVLRLDRQLNDFFNYLDLTIGADHLLMALTADHGVAPTAEFARHERLFDAHWDEGEFLADLKSQLNEEFGMGRYLAASKTYGGNLFLNHATIERKKLTTEQVTSFIREVALASGKFQACYTREQLLDGRAPGPLGQIVQNGYNAERGGDVVLVTKPYLLPASGKTGTTHGSPYAYDSHVPILFYGGAFKTGRYSGPVNITDIAPTLCAILRISEPSGCTGMVVSELLSGL